MTPAGLNRICRVIRFSYPQDDSVGGAIPSGTVIQENLQIRIKAEDSTQALMEQGIEVPVFYRGLLFAGNANIRNNDQIEFTAPINDWYYAKKFRVVGEPQRASSHPALDRNQLRIKLRRWESSHSNDIQ